MIWEMIKELEVLGRLDNCLMCEKLCLFVCVGVFVQELAPTMSCLVYVL